MAEIRARGRGPLIWPWILGLTVAAVLIWLLGERMAATPGREAPEKVRPGPVTAPAARMQRDDAAIPLRS